MAHCQGPALKWLEFFSGLNLYLAGRGCEIFQSTRGPVQCKSGPGIAMASERNHLMYHFSITVHLHLASLYAQNNFF